MKPWIIIIPLAILAGGWFLLKLNQPDYTPTDNITTTQQADPVSKSVSNPLATKPAEPDLATSSAPRNPKPVTEPAVATTTRSVRSDYDLNILGSTSIDDDDFARISNSLRSDPTLLPDILTEYRLNTDPERAKHLAALIAKLRDPRIVPVAAELAYSGDPQSQKNGLELLSRLQPNNDKAREIAIGLLASETSPDMLVATMNVLATPASTASATQKQMILDNISLLSTHSDENVRAHSMALMGRWAKNDPNVIDTLTYGLNDTSSHVRARAVSALSGTANPDQRVVSGLFSLLENTDELKTTRQTAMLALQRLTLSPALQTRFEQAQKSLRTRRLTQ